MAMVIVFVFVMAGVGGAVFLGLNAGDEDKRIDTEETALIYGNANHDYAVDELDIKELQDIIDEKTTWDKKERFLADADNNGSIDEKDIEIVKNIIDDKPCKIWYWNANNEAQQIDFPQTGKKLALLYWQQAELVSILGLWDDVVVANESIMHKDHLYDLTNVKQMGTSDYGWIDDNDTEILLNNKVDLLVAWGDPNLKPIMDPLKPLGVETVYLGESGKNCFASALTLGIMTGTEERAEMYLNYWNDTKLLIEDKLAEIDKKPSIVITMIHRNEDVMYPSWGGIFTSVNEPNAEWGLLQMFGNVHTADPGEWGVDMGRQFYTTEWFLQHPFDYQIVMASGIKVSGSQDAFNTWFEDATEKWFGQTEQYKNGNMCGVTYSLGGFSAYSMLPVVAWMIYPELFTQEWAEQEMQEFYNLFTEKKPDIHDMPSFYTGHGYDASYIE